MLLEALVSFCGSIETEGQLVIAVIFGVLQELVSHHMRDSPLSLSLPCLPLI